MTGQISTRKLTTAFDLPLLVFLVSAAVGVWIAYDKRAAWLKLALVVLGMAIYGGLARMPERIRIGRWREVPVLKWILGSLPALIAIYFFLTNDWSNRIGKVPGLDPVMRWFASWQPDLASLQVNSNVIGGVIAALLPLQIAALFQDRKGNRVWIGVLFMGLSGLGLLMSASRGAWLAFAFVLIAWATCPRGSFRPLGSKPIWAAVVVIVLLSIIAFFVLTPLGEGLLRLRSDRLEVWRNSLDLAGDYAFTGLGLDNFDMAYSSYVLLVHVLHTAHAHNLFLDIWLEHGLLGLFAVVGLIVTAVWPSQATCRWKPAALASLSVVLLHGMVDDAFYGYGGHAVFLLFIPFAVLAHSETPSASSHSTRPVLLAWAGLTAMLVMAAFTPGVQAAFKANLGAVIQTQVELTGYRWPESKYQDVVRLSAPERLAPAIAWYQSALVSNPSDTTANRRLGQIELSLQRFDAGCKHLLTAYTTAPDQRATRQLLGECYALAGNIEKAVALWQTIDVNQNQLQLRQWWYAEYLHDRENATRLTQAILTLDQ